MPPSGQRTLVLDHFIGHDDVGWLQPLQLRLGIAMGNKTRTKVFEWLATGDVIVVVVAVDDVFDGLTCHLLDLIDVGGDRLRAPKTDGIGRNDPIRGDDEH